MTDLKSLFLLDPHTTYLNHGSFGACPVPVFDVYQEWQRRLERQPCRFFTRELPEELRIAREVLGSFINTHADSVVFIPNATFGLNAIARSLPLEPGDEILATDHEYGACDCLWEYICTKRKSRYIRTHLPLPLPPQDKLIELFWEGVTGRTRVIFISHITSSTAQCFPVEEICALARKSGIITVIDGAHSLGQLRLDLKKIDPDFYVSNAHKWLCAPKGSAFLYARHTAQPLIEPLIVSWGNTRGGILCTGNPFLDSYQWAGTHDFSSYLTVPDAISFQEENDWPAVRRDSHHLLATALRCTEELTGCAPLYCDNAYFHQMGIFGLPPQYDSTVVKNLLYEKYHIEIPVISWNGMPLVRVSVQCYNTGADIDRLLEALRLIMGDSA